MATTALRDYQTAAINKTWRELQCKDAVQVVLPSGSGKTRIIAELANKFHHKTGKRVLVIAPMRELVLHAEREISMCTRLSVSLEMAEQRARHTTVVCATKHTMLSRLKDYKRDTFGLLVFDESDLAAADTYDKIRKYFRKAKVYGTTATPDRHDGRENIAPVVFSKNLKDQIEAGILSRVRRIGVTVTEVSRAKLLAGDFDPKWLDEIFSREKHLHTVVKTMLAKSDKRPTLVFGTTVLHAKLLSNLFNRYRSGCARWVSGKTENNTETLEEFRRGEFQFLCNCMLVSRGVDIPPVACIGMAAPTLSHTKYIQMLGRGTRRSPGKKNLLVVDFTFNSDVHALDAVDAVAGDGKEEIGVRTRETKQAEFDIVDVINEVEGELESNRKLRERIQAKVRVEYRRVKGIDWSLITAEEWARSTNKQLAKKLDCVETAVRKHRPKNTPPPNRPNWALITNEMWRMMTNTQIAKKMNNSTSAVSNHRPKNTPSPYRESRSSFYLSSITNEMWQTMNDIQIAKKLGCTGHTIGLYRPKNIPSPGKESVFGWSLITDEMWQTMTNRQIAKKMNSSTSAVSNHRPKNITSPSKWHQRKNTGH